MSRTHIALYGGAAALLAAAAAYTFWLNRRRSVRIGSVHLSFDDLARSKALSSSSRNDKGTHQ